MDILRLNEHCLDHTFDFLDAIDVINVWRTSEKFNFAIKRCIRNKIVDLATLLRQIPCDDGVKQYFIENGREIRRLALYELSFIELQIDFEFLLLHCTNLEEIQIKISWTDDIDRAMLFRFLAIHKKLRVFKISGDFKDVMSVVRYVTKHCTNLEKVEIRMLPSEVSEVSEDPNQESLSDSVFDSLEKLRVVKIERYPGNNIAKEVSKLKDLSILHMTTCQVTGRYLNGLKKLEELNLHGCYRLQLGHLIDILKSNIDLRKLNIAYCCIQFSALAGTAATQKNLEWLQMNSCFYDCFIIQELRSLKHLRIFEIERSVSRFERFLKQLAHFHRSSIQTLEIFNRSQILDVNDCSEIASFQNLANLALRGIKGLDDDYLRRISNACQQLAIVDLWDSGSSITDDGLLDFIRNAKNLTQLKISKYNHFSAILYNQIVRIRTTEVRHKFPLKIYLPGSDVIENIFNTKEYSESEKFVRLILDRDILHDFF